MNTFLTVFYAAVVLQSLLIMFFTNITGNGWIPVLLKITFRIFPTLIAFAAALLIAVRLGLLVKV